MNQMATQIEPPAKPLPDSLPKAAERMGYSILRALDRMGFVHQNADGSVFTVRFSDAILFSDELLALVIDVERLWHFSVGDLSKTRVTEHLSAVVRHPVCAVNANGLTYLVKLKAPRSEPIAQLPNKVELDLSLRPPGAYVIPVGVLPTGALWKPITDMGHILIGGSTGSGKSSWIQSALVSLLSSHTPSQIQVVMIDPKQVEFNVWKNAPHLFRPVACELGEATQASKDLLAETERRFTLFASRAVRSWNAYNEIAPEPLSLIVCLVDEFLDLVE
jgi:hypothetical protein